MLQFKDGLVEMAILKIARMGNPVLAKTSDVVEDPTNPQIHSLINDMIETMQDAPGIGLAAPQVHVSKRIIIFYVPVSRMPVGQNGVGLTALINPEIEPLTDEKELGVEGCLSLPWMAGKVRRYTKVRYFGLLPNGEQLTVEAEGYHARVVQHEVDHLDGILYPMRMESLLTFGYTDELQKLIEQNGVNEIDV
jgi:peptide deformylase